MVTYTFKCLIIIVRNTFLFFLIINSLQTKGQEDFSWWNKKHNWDGHTHWTQYMIYSPGFMGPNALPVPALLDGKLQKESQFEFGWAGYFSPGETTLNGTSRFRYIIGDGLAAIELNYVFLEYYKTDTLIRDERFARGFEGEGFAVGDVHISTIITLLKNRSFPDLLLRINLQTASGSKLSDARFTDAPAYFFDLIFGKDLLDASKKPYQLRLYGNIGFYAWQTGYTYNRQNDALLAGLGLSLRSGNHKLSTETAGYFGYLDQRDKPVVQRLYYEHRHQDMAVKVSYEKGLNDLYYNSFRLSMMLLF